MYIEQIAVFIENQPGRLRDILQFLAEAKVDLRAYSVAETSDFGVLRMIVRDSDATLATLKSKGFTAKKVEVLGLLIPDALGSSVQALAVLLQAGINIEYTYAFALPATQHAVVLLRVSDLPQAAALLQAQGVRLATLNDLI